MAFVSDNPAANPFVKRRPFDFSPFFGALALSSFLIFASGILLRFSNIAVLSSVDWSFAFLSLAAGELFFRGWLAKKTGLLKSMLAFLVIFSLLYLPLLFSNPVELLVFLLIYGAGMSVLRMREDEWTCAFAAILYCALTMAYFEVSYVSYAYIQLFLISLPLYLSLRWRGFRSAMAQFGIRREGLFRNIGIGAAATVLLLIAFEGLLLVFQALGLNDMQNITQTSESFPQFVVVMSFTLTPVAEELFFRGLLFPFAGAFLSSAVFSISHYQYGSVVELVVAFLIGYSYCWLYKKTGSLIPAMVSHALFNLLFFLSTGRL